MRRALIVALVLVNLGFLAGIIWKAGATPVKAQVIGAATDYIVLTGKTGGGEEALYIADLGRRSLLAFEYDRREDAMVPFQGIRLLREFGRDQGRP